MIERSKERQTRWDSARSLKTLRHLVLAAGLILNPASGKASEDESSYTSYSEPATETYIPQELSLKEWQRYLEARAPNILDLKQRVQKSMNSIKERAADCKEKIPDAHSHVVEDTYERVQKLLEREANFLSSINVLPYDIRTPHPSTATESGEEGFGESGTFENLPLIDFDKIPDSTFSELEQEGRDLLADIRAFDEEVKNDTELQRALKHIFWRAGCLVF